MIELEVIFAAVAFEEDFRVLGGNHGVGRLERGGLGTGELLVQGWERGGDSNDHPSRKSTARMLPHLAP